MAEGKRIEIRNFGVFSVYSRDARVGRNPRTGEVVDIPIRRVAQFKPGKILKSSVEKGYVDHEAAEVSTDESNEA